MQINPMYESMVYLYTISININTMIQVCNYFNFSDKSLIQTGINIRKELDNYYSNLVGLCKETKQVVPTANTLIDLYSQAHHTNISNRRYKNSDNRFPLLTNSARMVTDIYSYPHDPYQLRSILKNYIKDFELFVIALNSWTRNTKYTKKPIKDKYIDLFNNGYQNMLNIV